MKVVRKQALIPLLVLAVTAFLYFTLLFDLHLRWVLSWGLTEINSAQVDIASLNTGFFPPHLKIGKMEWTQPDMPTRNRLEVGAVEVALNGDALLRGKMVIERALVTGVSGGGMRARPGQVYFPIASNPDTAMGKLWVRIKEEAAQTGLGQVAQLLQGFDPRAQLAKLGDLGQLNSLKQMAELQARASAKRTEWQNTLKQIPGDKEIAAIQARVSSLNIGGNPAQIQGQIAEAGKLVSESQGLAQSVRDKSAVLQADVAQLSQSAAAVPEWIAQDQRDLEGKLKLPQLDAARISAQILGPRILGALKMAEPYLHGKSQASDPKPASRAGTRLTGRIYEFGRLKSIPAFWLKQAELTGAVGAGTLEVKAMNLSSQPAWIAATPTLTAQAKQFPLDSFALSQSEGMKLILTHARSAGSLAARFAGATLDLRGQLQLTDAQYEVAAQPALLQDLLKDATAGLKTAQFGVDVSGTWDSPVFRVTSSVGDAIARAVRSRLDAQVAQVRAEISKRVHAQVDSKSKALQEQVDGNRNMVLSEVTSRQKQAEAVQAQAQAKVAQAQAQLTRSAGEGLRRKLPF